MQSKKFVTINKHLFKKKIMTVNTKQKNPDFSQKILKRYQDSALVEIAVGFPRGKKSSKEHSKAKISMIDLALVHEFGSVKRNIPKRSFIKASDQSLIEETRPFFKKISENNNRSNKDNVTLFKAAALKAQSEVQLTLTNLTSPKLSEVTIKNKGSSALLIDTGALRASITGISRKKTK